MEPPRWVFRFKQAVDILQRPSSAVRHEEPSADDGNEGDGPVDEPDLGLKIRVVCVQQKWQCERNEKATGAVSISM